jgi:predicted transcriptional regulator
MTKWKDLRKELLSNPDVKKEYDRLAPRYAIISQLIVARNKKGLTQGQLAERMGTRQSAIARLESGNVNPTIGFLDKAASVLGAKLTIRLR